jgi:hypothetical protein
LFSITAISAPNGSALTLGSGTTSGRQAKSLAHQLFSNCRSRNVTDHIPFFSCERQAWRFEMHMKKTAVLAAALVALSGFAFAQGGGGGGGGAGGGAAASGTSGGSSGGIGGTTSGSTGANGTTSAPSSTSNSSGTGNPSGSPATNSLGNTNNTGVMPSTGNSGNR